MREHTNSTPEGETMTGTPKQIDFATDIRARHMAGIDRLCAMSEIGRELGRRGHTAARMGITSREACLEFCARIKAAAVGIDAAAWWIEHRDDADLAAVGRALDEATA